MPNFSLLDPPRPSGVRDTLYWQRPAGAGIALALARLADDAPLLIITADTAGAQRLENDLNAFARVPVLAFPDWETLPYDSFSPHQEIISARLRTLRRLQDGEHGIVLVPINTLMQRLPPVDYIAGRVLTLEVGMRLDRENFRDRLSRAGYRAVETVYEPGEYALRGALIDLFPMGSEGPLRIDLFDDEIDTLRRFDPDTQRSQDKVERVELLPAHEYSLARSAIACFREGFETLFDVDPRQCPLYVDALKGIPAPGSSSTCRYSSRRQRRCSITWPKAPGWPCYPACSRPPNTTGPPSKAVTTTCASIPRAPCFRPSAPSSR